MKSIPSWAMALGAVLLALWLWPQLRGLLSGLPVIGKLIP